MTELELERLPDESPVDEDSQSIVATRGDVRRIIREEMQSALQDLVTRDDLDRSLERERAETRKQLESDMNTERGARTAAINAVENRVHEITRDIMNGMRRIEDNITSTLGAISNAVNTTSSTLTDVVRRVGSLERTDIDTGKRIERLDDEMRGHFERVSDDMQLITTSIRGDAATGIIGFTERLNAVSGRNELTAGEVEAVKKSVAEMKKSLESVEAFFNSVRQTWQVMTRTTTRKVASGVGGLAGVSVIVYIAEHVIPTIVKILGG